MLNASNLGVKMVAPTDLSLTSSSIDYESNACRPTLNR